jgi:hypothetical protein
VVVFTVTSACAAIEPAAMAASNKLRFMRAPWLFELSARACIPEARGPCPCLDLATPAAR